MKIFLSILLISAGSLGCDLTRTSLPSNENSGSANLVTNSSTVVEQEPADKPVEDPVSLREESRVDGEFQKAFLECYDAFKNEEKIPVGLRRLENYSIRFRQKNSYYYVLFYAKHPPGRPISLGGSTELGVDIMYTVRRSDLKIVEKNTFK